MASCAKAQSSLIIRVLGPIRQGKVKEKTPKRTDLTMASNLLTMASKNMSEDSIQVLMLLSLSRPHWLGCGLGVLVGLGPLFHRRIPIP